MRRTKIIATLGPAVGKLSKMVELVEAGCDVARLNVAHGTVEEHRMLLKMFRRASEEVGKTTAVMLDIKGPEIRVAKTKYHFLKPGERVIIGAGGDIEFNHKIAYDVIDEGTKILIHDGEMEITIDGRKKDVYTGYVVRGGVISEGMGVNIPGKRVPVPYVQERDVRFIAELKDVDFIAASFVRDAGDINSVRRVMKEHHVDAAIIAKIENEQGVENIEDILLVSDGIMVARGDLGTELPLEDLPAVQKQLITRARERGKPAIIATQILESMVRNPYPTRAEVSDIANAILEGADALMLSEETAIGKYPVEAVRVLSKVAEKADSLLLSEKKFLELRGTISECVSNAAVLLAQEINASSILSITRSGKTARLVSRHRPQMPVIGATNSVRVLRQMSILWGVRGVLVDIHQDMERVVKEAIEISIEKGMVKKGDILVIVGGEPSSVKGTTNFVWAQIVGHVLARGTGFGEGAITGRLCREAGKCDILLVEEMKDIPADKVKGVVIESNIYDPAKLRKLAKYGLKIVAGTGKIGVEDTIITLDASRGILWK